MVKPLPTEYLQKACDVYHKHGCNKAAAAEELGIPRATFQHHVELFRTRKIVPNVSTKDTVAEAQNDNLQKIVQGLRNELNICKRSLAEAVRPRFTIRHDNIKRSEKTRGVIIGDAHNSPHIPDKSRFEWIGAHINTVKPDFVESIGDFESWDSLNGHDGNETFMGRSKPTFSEDLADMGLGLQALSSRLNWNCEFHRDEGNHERRIYNFENLHPETNGTMVFQFHNMLEAHGWTHSPYGCINYRGGVGFVHCAINRLGKSYGGKNAEQTISNDSVHDLVIGHSHTQRMHRAPKIGGNGYVQILNVGCALPDGHIEPYAKHALNGWSYGIMEVTIQHGKISDYSWVSMERLKELYG